MLTQSRYWRAALSRGGSGVVLSLVRDALPEDLTELVGLEIEVPLTRWEDVLRHVRLDRQAERGGELASGHL